MKVSICRPCELSAAEIERWRWFQQSSDFLRSPFLSPEFACAMSRQRPEIMLAVVEDGGETVAYFAFERMRLGVGRALGYGLSDSQGLVHAPGFEWDSQELLRACNLSTWEFDNLLGAQVQRFAPQEVVRRASLTVDLTNGWQSWIERKRTTKRFKQIRQRERKLDRERGPARYEFDSRSHAHLELLMRWKSAQYRRTGRMDRFASRWFTEALRELFDTRTGSFSTQLSTMYVRGCPASLDLALRGREILAGWFPAYDRAFSPYGVGLLHLMNFLRLGAEHGVRFFELGPGEAEYKADFADFAVMVARGSLRRPTPAAMARRLQMAPKRMATDFVLSRPALRKMARDALRQVGTVRSRLYWGLLGGGLLTLPLAVGT